MLNLDTHVLIHALQGNLLPRERSLLTKNSWGISAIVLWELAKLSQLGRVILDFDAPEVDEALYCVHVCSRALNVASASTQLDVRGDPADGSIAAPGIGRRVPLIARAKRIRRSKIVPLAK